METKIVLSALFAHGVPQAVASAIYAGWDRAKFPDLKDYLEHISLGIYDGAGDLMHNETARRHGVRR